MQFLLLGYDGTDPGAPERRQKVRKDHLERISKLKKDGEFIIGGAILNDEGQMTGSMIVYDFPDRESLDRRLKDEPYITEGVWEKVKINPFRVAKME